MFTKGLIHKVNIYPVEHNTSNRTKKNQVRVNEKTLENISCRIIKDEKIMFKPNIKLEIGDVIEDIDLGNKYTVEGEYKATGLYVHHRTYKVKKKVI